MKRYQAFTSYIAGAMTIATLFGTSAFAENRHRDATPAEQRMEAEGFESAAVAVSDDGSEKRANGSDDARDYRIRGREPQRVEPTRDYPVRGSSLRGTNGNGQQSEQFVTDQGRISRVERDRNANGYRVWLDGGRYTYFVPEEQYNNFHFQVGTTVHFGGYWSPAGYVTVYDVGGYPGYSPVYRSRYLHGTVVRVDYRRGLLTLDDDVSGRWVYVELGRDARMDDLRRGDRVEFKGEWYRDRYFRAYRITYLDDDDYDDWHGGGYRR